MIIQGTNCPIIFTFSESMENILDIEISLHSKTEEYKHWTLSDVTISGNTVTAPIKQSESIDFPVGPVLIEVKWMDANGKTNFSKEINNIIVERHDKTIMEGAD